MNRYILVYTWYVLVNGSFMQAFEEGSAMLSCATWSPRPLDSEQEQGLGDPDVLPEDEEFFDTPDANAMKQAISKFVN